MEVVMPISSPSHDFYFPSNSLYTSAPASPKPFGNPSENYYFLSAPASPRGSSFNWEEKPEADAFDFAFEFSGEVEGEAPAAADELFEGGRIRPLNCSSLRQSSTKSREEIELRQGRGKGVAADAIQKINLIGNSSEIASGGERGRGRAPASASGGYARGRRAARSLSPLRGGHGEFENSRNSAAAPSSTSLMRGCGSKKWSLKDLFLFRSASDGRVIGRGSKDPLRKYTLLPSFASSSSSSSPSLPSSSFTPPSKVKKNGEAGATASRSGRASMASVHETHYTTNRAASEEMKKKTPLPFHRNSLFGYLRFNPAINSVGRRLNSFSLHRGRS